jgi:hypothetical protein
MSRIVARVWSNNTLNTDDQQASACWFAPRVRGAGALA